MLCEKRGLSLQQQASKVPHAQGRDFMPLSPTQLVCRLSMCALQAVSDASRAGLPVEHVFLSGCAPRYIQKSISQDRSVNTKWAWPSCFTVAAGSTLLTIHNRECMTCCIH